jgi:hypothetical protein
MKTMFFCNGDLHRQKPLRFSECFDMTARELYRVFHSGNYRRNTGTFLMTDCLAKNLDAEPVSAWDFEKIREYKASAIVTNALHCVSPRFVFDRAYWQKILDLGIKLVPMTFGFRYHENGEYYLTDDMVYIFKQISERNEIGVRGEFIADILCGYGIKNVRIIGCHSLFYHMDRGFRIDVSKRDCNRINFNFNQCYSDYFQSHLDFCRESLPVFNYFLSLFEGKKVAVDYTMQTAFMKELTGFTNFTDFGAVKDFVMSRGRYFFSVDDWMNALKENDFSIGTQFHGNVAAVLAGTPALLITIDRRMEELARYHGMPFMKAEDFDPNLEIGYYREICDYTEFNKRYPVCYDEFIDYCVKNDIALKAETR